MRSFAENKPISKKKKNRNKKRGKYENTENSGDDSEASKISEFNLGDSESEEEFNGTNLHKKEDDQSMSDGDSNEGGDLNEEMDAMEP